MVRCEATAMHVDYGTTKGDAAAGDPLRFRKAIRSLCTAGTQR